METNNPIDALRSAGNEFTFSTDVDSRVPDFAKLSHRRNNRRLLVGAALALGLMIPTAASFLSARDSAPQIAIAEKGKAKKKVTKKKKTVKPSSPVVPVSSNSAAAQELGLSATEVISADQGFRSGRDGFNFANYGGAPTDDAIDATVMVALFGRSNVCANATGSDCVELPGAIDVKNQLNDAMAAGRCEGFATLSQRFFDGIDQRPNGARETGAVARLEVAKQISYWWATQVAPTVASSAKQYRAMAPSGIVAALIKGMAEKSGLTLGLYSSTGGHSISPLAVTKDGANWNIYVYDNNYPKEIRKVVVNGSNETWTYGGASLNSASAGDTWTGTGAGTMDLTPMSARKGPFNVSFGSTKGATKGSVYRVFVTQKPKKKGAVATTPLGAVLQVGEKSVNSSNFVAAGKEPFNARTFMAGSRGVGVVAYIPVTPGPSGDVRVRPTGDPTSGVFAVSMDRPGLPSLYASSSATFTMVGRDGSKSDSITIEGVTAPVYIKTSANGVSHTFSLDKGNKYIVEATATTATFTVLDKSGEAVYEGAIPVNVPKGTVINIDHEFDPITKEWDTTTTNGVAAKIDNYFVENLSVTAPKSKVLTPAVTTTTSTTVPAFNGIELPLRAIANTTTTLPPLQAAPAPTTTVAETTTTTVAPTTTIATTTTTTLAPDAVAVSVAGTRFYGSDDSSIIWKWSCDGSTVGCEWAKAQFDDSKMEVKVSATKSSAASDTPYSGTMSLVDGVSAPSTIKLTTSVALMVEPRALTVTANAKSKTYGDKDPALTATTVGLVDGDTLVGVLSRDSGENAGTFDITQGTVTDANNPNYKINFTKGTFTINKLAVVVTPDAGQSKTYGDNDPEKFTYTTSPADISLSGKLAYTGSNAGLRPFTLGNMDTANDTNYIVTLSGTPVNFTINKKAVTVTAEAKTKVYGDNDPEKFTYLTDVELVSGDDFTGSLTRENTSKAVGTYAITQGSLALSSNYTIIFTGADFKITPKPITVTADAKSKVYGEADPPLTYQVIGTLESGDVFTGALSRDAGSNVGEYAITKDNLALNANYSITFVAAKLTVTAADLTVTAADKSKVYGSDDPALTYDVTGFKLTDTKESVMTGALSRVAGENISAVGYAINQGTVDANSNYSIKNFAAAKLTITKRDLVITPTSGLSKFVGELDPPLTFTTSSFYYSDTIQNALTGSLSYSGSTVGSYPITLGGLGAVNYNLTLGATVNFEIKARPATTLTYAEIKGGNIQPAVSVSSGDSLIVGSGKKFRLTAGGFTTNIVWSVNGLEVNSVTVSQTSSGCRMEYISGTAVNVDGVTNSCTATVHIKVGTTEVFKLNLIP